MTRSSQLDGYFAEVDFGVPDGVAGLRDKAGRVTTALLNTDLWPAFGHVGRHHWVGNVVHAVFIAESGEDPGGRMPMLAGGVKISDQPRFNNFLERGPASKAAAGNRDSA